MQRTVWWLSEVGGVVRSQRVGKMVKGSKVKLPVIKQISPGDVMYDMVTIVNNAVLHKINP